MENEYSLNQMLIQKRIGQRIKELREDSGKTQAEIAEQLKTSAQHYGKYELGLTEIPLYRALKLANIFDVSLDYITGRTNDKNSHKKAETAPKSQKPVIYVSDLSDIDIRIFSDKAE